MRNIINFFLLLLLMGCVGVAKGQDTIFSADFEDSRFDSVWRLNEGNPVNYWVIDSAACYDWNGRGMYITDNDNHLNEYEGNMLSYSYAFTHINFNDGEYSYFYHWLCGGDRFLDYMRVFLVPDSVRIIGGVDMGVNYNRLPEGWIAMDGGAYLNEFSSWREQSGSFEIPRDGGYWLVYYWVNNVSGVHQPPAAVDNILITYNSRCQKPMNLRSYDVMFNSVGVAWSEVGAASSWRVECVPAGMDRGVNNSILVFDSMMYFDNLQPNTEYDVYVESVCDEGMSCASKIRVKTECRTMGLPFVEDFDYEAGGLDCWNVISGHAFFVNDASSAYQGNGYVRIYGDAVLATPYVPINSNMIGISMMVKRAWGLNEGLEVGFVTDLDDMSSMIIIDTIVVGDRYELYYRDFSSLSIMEMGYIVLREISLEDAPTRGCFYIDDVYINSYDVFGCLAPTRTALTVVDQWNVMLEWSSYNNAMQFEVVYGMVDDPNSSQNTIVSVYGVSDISINSLTENSLYYFWVRSVCNRYDVSPWIYIGSLMTDELCAEVTNIRATPDQTGIGLSWDYNNIRGLPHLGAKVSWREVGDTAIYSDVVDTNYYFINGLKPMTDYEIMVATRCDACYADSVRSVVKTLAHTVVVGDGTYQCTDVPVTINHMFSYCQMLYPASELVGVDKVSAIGFDMSGTGDSMWVDIYMGNVSQASLSLTDYVPIDRLSKVGENVLLVVNSGMHYLYLDTVFEVVEDSNLVVAIDMDCNNVITYVASRSHVGTSVYCNESHSDIDLHNLGSMSFMNRVPNITFLIKDECYAPLLTVTNIESSWVELVWSDYEESEYVVEYKLLYDTVWEVAASEYYDNSIVVGDLGPSMKYVFRVGKICGDEMKYSEIKCITKAGAMSVPIYDDFSDVQNNRFRVFGNVYGLYAPRPWYGNLNLNKVGDYIIMSEALEPMNELHVMFKMWSRNLEGEASLALAVGNNNQDWRSFEYIDTFTVNSMSGVKLFEHTMLDYDGEGQFVALVALDTGIYVDDVLLDIAPGCGYPYDLGVSSITATSAHVSWLDNNTMGNVYDWLVVYGLDGDVSDSLVVHQPWCDLTDLWMNKHYEVMVYTLCDGDTLPSLNSCDFYTDCGEMALPYFESFDNLAEGRTPSCWFTHISDRPWTEELVPTVTSMGNNKAVMMGCKVHLVTPYIPLPANKIYVEYDAMVTYRQSGAIAVGFSQSRTNMDSVVYVDTIRYDGGMWHHYATSFAELDSSWYGYVVFANIENEWRYQVGLDNIAVLEDNGCGAVENIKVVGRTTHSITLSFDDMGGARNYRIGISKRDDPMRMYRIENFDTTTYCVEGLEESTQYYMWISINCENGSGRWVKCPITITECEARLLSYREDFNNFLDYSDNGEPTELSLSALPECWSFLNLSYDKCKYPQAFICQETRQQINGERIVVKGLYCKVNSEPLYFALPRFECSLDDLELRFKYGNMDGAVIELGVLSDITDTASFRSLRTYRDVYSLREELHSFVVDGLDSTMDYVIAFRISSASGEMVNVMMDDISVIRANRCVTPEILRLVRIGSDEVEVSWIGNANEYEVVYRERGSNDWILIGPLTDTTITVGNLIPNKEYYLKVRSLCGFWRSNWCEDVLFRTICTMKEVPYYESFDLSTNFPECWSKYEEYNHYVNVADVNNFTESGYSLILQPDKFKKVTVALPMVDQVLDSLRINFSYRTSGVSLWEPCFELGVMTDLRDKHSFRMLDSIPVTPVLKNIGIELSEYGPFDVDSTYYLAFRYGGSIVDHRFVSIDNVLIDNVSNVDCREPINMRDSSIATGRVKCMWEGESMIYKFEYRQRGTYEWRSYMLYGNKSIELKQLSLNTTYECRVRSECNERGSSEWVYHTFYTDYEGEICAAPTNVMLRSMGGSYISLDWDCDNSVERWQCKLLVNHEVVWEDIVTTNGVPLRDCPFDTEIRLQVRSICGTGIYSEWGESELFCISTSGCSAVEGTVANEITDTTANITWISDTGDYAWDIEYGKRYYEKGEGTKVRVYEPNYGIRGLNSGEEYDVYIRSVCEEGRESYWRRMDFKTTGGVGIDGVEGEYVFRVYPNPTTGSANIYLQGVTGRVRVNVIDINGRGLLNREFECDGDCETHLEVGNLARGTYFVQVVGDRIYSVRKLIVR